MVRIPTGGAAQLRRQASSLQVAIVSDSAPGRNGVATYYQDLAASLQNRVAGIDLITPEPATGAQIRVRMPGDSSQMLSLPSYRKVSARLSATAPDVVIVATPGPYGLLGSHLSRRRRSRLIVGFHTNFAQLLDLYWHRFSGPLPRRVAEAAQRRMFGRADLVIVNSPQMREATNDLSAPPVALVGTPLPGKYLTTPPTPLRDPLRRVLFAGRLAPEKNLDAVLDAARELPQLQFLVAGDGPQRGAVEAAAKRLSNLRYLGWLDRDGLLQALDGSDTLVLPSRFESFGTVALEALARNRCTLVSPGCGIRDWPELARGLFQIGHGESVADALRRLCATDPAIRREKTARGLAAARRQHEWTRDLWLRLLRGGPAENRVSTVRHPSFPAID